jgi:hypothetical protein
LRKFYARGVASAVDVPCDHRRRAGRSADTITGFIVGAVGQNTQCTSARRRKGDTVQRIAAQIGTSTPDKPVLKLEIRTDDCTSLEKAIHATLQYRGRKIDGGGKEWFKTTREEIKNIYEIVSQNT